MAKKRKKKIIKTRDLDTLRRNPSLGAEAKKVVRKVKRAVRKITKLKRNPARRASTAKRRRPRAVRYVIAANLRSGGTMYFDGKHWHENRDRAEVLHSAAAVKVAMKGMRNRLPLQIRSVEGKRV